MTTMQKAQLVATLEGCENALGEIVYWNVRNVQIQRQQLIVLLESVGLPGSFAREHSYLSAFKRALKFMEENRIIRPVEENAGIMVYQFTAESKAEDDMVLEYNREATITINKSDYRKDRNFRAAIQGPDDICNRLAELFEDEKTKFRSSDITRLIQRIFSSHADIVCLRQQGGVYYVPAVFHDLVVKVSSLVSQLGNSTLEHLPIPNVDSTRQAVRGGLVEEIGAVMKKLDEDIEKVKAGDDEATERWTLHRTQQVAALRDRVARYAEVLGDRDTERFQTSFAALEKAITNPRVLNL